jgi:hypothetical protein
MMQKFRIFFIKQIFVVNQTANLQKNPHITTPLLDKGTRKTSDRQEVKKDCAAG